MTVPLIVVAVTQFLMQAFSGPLAALAGKWRLLIVTGLSLITAVASGVTTGMSLGSALLSGAGLAALQVFGHQLYVQFFGDA
jgi:hypothetical protein